MDVLPALVLGVHIVGAALWVGGSIFLGLIVRVFPAAEDRSPAEEARVAEIARATAWVLWPALVVTLATGVLNFEFVYAPDPADWLSTPSGPFLAAKLVVVAVMVGTAAAHSFGVGPRIRRRRAAGATFAELRPLRRLNGVLGGVSALAGILVLLLAAFVGSF